MEYAVHEADGGGLVGVRLGQLDVDLPFTALVDACEGKGEDSGEVITRVSSGKICSKDRSSDLPPIGARTVFGAVELDDKLAHAVSVGHFHLVVAHQTEGEPKGEERG